PRSPRRATPGPVRAWASTRLKRSSTGCSSTVRAQTARVLLQRIDTATAQWEPDGNRRHKRRRQGLGNWKIIRYADDFVIMVHGERHHAQERKAEVAQVWSRLRQRQAQEKTRVVHIDEGFDSLGFHIRRRQKQGTRKRHVYTIPSKKSVQSIKDTARRKANRSARNTETGMKISEVDSVVRGWANYFRHGVSKKIFYTIDSFAWWRLSSWIRRKHSNINLGELRRRFTDRGWRLACNGAVYRGASSVEVTRYRSRGSKIPTPWSLKTASL